MSRTLSLSGIAAAALSTAVVLVLDAGTSVAGSSAQNRLKGDFGFYVNGADARPLPFAQIGRFNADNHGGISGNVTTQTSLGAGLLAATSASSLTGTYAVNDDGIGTMTLTIGAFHFVIDDAGNEIRLTQDLTAAAGVARRQSGPFSALANGNVPGSMRSNTLDCSGLVTNAPSPPDFPFGIPLRVGAVTILASGTASSIGFYSGNGFSAPVTLSGTIAFNADGTFQGDNAGQGFVGVLTSPNEDYYAMGVHPETIETCTFRQQ
jgi:hypothetical protein